MDTINVSNIQKMLNTKLNIEYYDTVTSTNTILKEKAKVMPDKSVIIANNQTCGRGRIGKSFFSPEDSGIYMSILLTKKIRTESLNLITPMAAVAMCKAIESVCNKKADIKWVNDIYIAGRKICGILTESSIDYKSNLSNYIVLGIGINVYKPKSKFPEDIENTAGYLLDEEINNIKDALIASFINTFLIYFDNLSKNDFFDEYKKRCFILGKKIEVIKYNESKKAVVLDLNENFNLIVKYDDEAEEILSSGEISIKINR